MPLARLIESLGQVASRRFGPLRVACLGVALCLPTLAGGLWVDDYLQRAQLRKPDAVQHLGRSEAGPYVLTGRDGPASVRFAKRAGALPFWTSPDLRLSFWKPLSALTHRADLAAFPNHPWLMHAHNLVWYLLLLCGTTLLYRRMHTKAAIAGLAALLYALDDGHVVAAGWVAGRNGLIAAVLAVLTIYFHDRGRRQPEPLSQVLAWLLVLPGLLASETYVAVCGYLFAHALTLDREPLLDRVRALVPYLALVLGWHALYAMLGYGAFGSSFVLDPGREPLLFGASLPSRLSLLLGSHFLLGSPELTANLGDDGVKLIAFVYLLVAAGVVKLGWPLLRGHRVARFWALGALLSAVPMCAAMASERHLLIPGVGAMGFLATLLHYALSDGARHRWSPLARRVTVGLATLHLLVSPLLAPVKAWALSDRFDLAHRCGESVAGRAEFTGQHLIALNAPDRCIFYAHVVAGLEPGPRPVSLRTLASGDAPTRVDRIDPYTLRITPEGGFFATPAGRMFVDHGRRFHADEELGADTPDLRIRVLGKNARGRPTAVEVRFAEPLERGPYVFLRANEEGLERMRPPATTTTLPEVSMSVP